MRKILFCFLLLFSPLLAYEVVGFGDPLVDYILFVNSEVLQALPGGKEGSIPISFESFESITRGQTIKLSGGRVMNILKGLSLLGHDSASIGKIGNCNDSKEYLKRLKSYRVSPHFFQTNKRIGRVACLITPEGKWAMRSYIEEDLSSELLVDEKVFDSAKIFHIDGFQLKNIPLVRRMIDLAQKRGCKISLDGGVPELVERHRADLLRLIEEKVDFLFINQREAEHLVGSKPEIAAQKLAKLCKIVVVTDGEKGGFVASKEGVFHFPAYSAEVVDETGAGDLFIAGFLHGLLTEQPYEYCADCGAQMAAKIVGCVGSEIAPSLWNTSLSQRTYVGNDHKIRKDLLTQNIADGIQGRASR